MFNYQQLIMNMEGASKLTSRRMPIFGMFSIAAPFLGVGLACAVFSLQPAGDESWFHPVLGVLLFFASLICGMFLAVIGQYREEKPQFLSWVGLLLNLLPTLLLLVSPFLE